MQQFSTEQIVRDRNSGTETKLNMQWIFKIKKLLTTDHISLYYLNKTS